MRRSPKYWYRNDEYYKVLSIQDKNRVRAAIENKREREFYELTHELRENYRDFFNHEIFEETIYFVQFQNLYEQINPRPIIFYAGQQAYRELKKMFEQWMNPKNT